MVQFLFVNIFFVKIKHFKNKFISVQITYIRICNNNKKDKKFQQQQNIKTKKKINKINFKPHYITMI